jgi:GNAT superfamily N-acetyltransferase
MTIDAEQAAAALEGQWNQMIAGAPQNLWRHLGDGIVAFISDLPTSSMNGVYVFRPDIDIDQVAGLLTEVSRANVPFCLHARASLRGALADVADAVGMSPDADVPMMALDDPAALGLATQVDGLGLRALTEREQGIHEGLFAAGFGMPTEMAHLFMQFLGATPGLRAFVGHVAGTGVTTAVTLPSGADSVGVYNVATPPDQRRHGYGAAVTAYATLDALDRGASWAWLRTTPAGHAVYQRLGFRVVEDWPVWVAGVED